MQEYMYISEKKVNMYFSQIDKKIIDKLTLNLGFNLGIIQAGIGADFSGKDNLFSKAAALEKYLADRDEIGSLVQPKMFIKETLYVKHIRSLHLNEMFILAGQKYEIYHLFGGSITNCIGNYTCGNVQIGLSYYKDMVSYLSHMFSYRYLRAHDENFAEEADPKNRGDIIPGLRPSEWANIVRGFYTQSDAEEFSVTILARYFSKGRTIKNEYCTISSPVYVVIDQ